MGLRPDRAVAGLPTIAGGAGVAQSVYGDVGNLELVIPDRDHGFWVFWFNADEVEHHHGAVVGRWSAGLFVDTGSRLEAVRIAQLRAGPQALEVSARSSNGVERWTWLAATGFLSKGFVRFGPARGASPIVEDMGDLHMLVLHNEGVSHLRADVGNYPAAEWVEARPFQYDGVTLVDLARTDEIGLVAALLVEQRVVLQARRGGEWGQVAGPGGRWATVAVAGLREGLFVVGRVGRSWVRIASRAGARWVTSYVSIGSGDLAVSASSLDGGMLEIVVGSGAERTHHRWSIRDRRLVNDDPSPIRSEFWAPRE